MLCTPLQRVVCLGGKKACRPCMPVQHMVSSGGMRKCVLPVLAVALGRIGACMLRMLLVRVIASG